MNVAPADLFLEFWIHHTFHTPRTLYSWNTIPVSGTGGTGCGTGRLSRAQSHQRKPRWYTCMNLDMLYLHVRPGATG